MVRNWTVWSSCQQKNTVQQEVEVFYDRKENFVSNLRRRGKVVFVFFGSYIHESIVNTVLFKLFLYRHLRLTKMNFCSSRLFSVPRGRPPAILNLICKIFHSFCVASYGRSLPILKQPWRVLEYRNKQYSYVPVKFVCIKILRK